jgi:hypothetical protein
MLVLAMASHSRAESYWVYGADNAEEVNGIYGYYGTYNTPKDDGCSPDPCPYANLDMPVYRKNGDHYYIGYRG